MGAKGGVNVFRGEFTPLRPVVGPGAPVTNNLKELKYKRRLKLFRASQDIPTKFAFLGYSSGSAGCQVPRQAGQISPRLTGTH